MSELADWLSEQSLSQYTSIFEENGIDMRALPYLTEEDFKELNVLLGHRRILMAGLAQLSPAATQTPSEPGAGSGVPEPIDAFPEAERRQVTVLFADIAGYTLLSNVLDAEEVHQILGAFFDSSDAIIREYGGTVDKHLGDCVMAVFGAPLARGNDPERAVQAAFKIQASMPDISRKMGQKLAVHIGIASGQVVASGVGNDAHYTVTGDSVNLASRLSDAAKAGETLISHQVQLSVSEHVLLDDRGELNIKGFKDPLPVYLLRAQRSAEMQNGQRIFVGRQAELQQMSGLLDACIQADAGQVVYVRGEAGIGKTRLTEKIAHVACEAGFACHRALVLDFGMSRDQSVVRALLSSLLAIPPDADASVRLRAAGKTVETQMLDEHQRLFLNEMLGIGQSKKLGALYDAMDNSTRQQGKLAVVVDLINFLSQNKPQFILIEDIHWAGKSVLSYLTQIAAAMAEIPCVLFATSRFEGDPLDSHWQSMMGVTPFMAIDLKPLRKRDALALAADSFDTSKQFALDCVERADGNPLFLEQLLRSAEEVGENLVPGSVQSIVQARLDAIELGDKRAIQAASVLGKHFFLGDLQNMIDDASYLVSNLIERQLIKPELEGRAYLFSHALVQEAVYQSLITSKRTELHRRAASLYEQAEPELCARHLDRANDSAAADAYLRAAQAHSDEQQHELALELLERGLELVESEQTRADLYRLKGDVLRNLGQVDASIEVFETALESVPDRQRECQALIGLAEGLRIVDLQQRALQALDRAQQLALHGELQNERAYIHYLRGNLNFMLGEIDTCLNEHQQALVYSDKAGSQTCKALALGGLGDAYYLRGHMQSAMDQFEECGRVCRQQGYGKIEVSNRHMAGWSRIFLMDFPAARVDALAAIEMAAKVKQQRAEVLGLKLAGVTEIEMGMDVAAELHLMRALALARQLQTGNFEAQAHILLARLYYSRGNIETAREYAAQAEEIVRMVGMAFIGPIVLAMQAELSPDLQQQRTYLKEAEQILDAGCVSHNQFWVARSAIEINLKNKNWDGVKSVIRRLERYTEEQPLQWSDFFIARGRALAAWGQGETTKEMREHLQVLSAQAGAAKMLQSQKAITSALSA